MNNISLGPYFSPCEFRSHYAGLESLGIQLEWACRESAIALPLFRVGSKPTTFERVVVNSERIPFAIECSSFQVIESVGVRFIPLEAVLVSLFLNHHASRDVLAVLAEFYRMTPMHHRVSHPISDRGMLMPAVEQAGFRLNTILRQGPVVYADLVWEVPDGRFRFHTRIAKFEIQPDGSLAEGCWVPPGTVGVSTLLTRELDKVSPGPVRLSFSQAGLSLLKSLRERMSPNKMANENPVSIGVSGSL